MNLHNHAKFKTSENWDFYRSLHLGCNGWAGSEYYLVRKADDKAYGFDTQRDAKNFLEQIGEDIAWSPCSDYKEIKG